MAAPGRLPKSIATVCLSGALPDKLEAASAAGFAAFWIRRLRTPPGGGEAGTEVGRPAAASVLIGVLTDFLRRGRG